MKQIQLLKLSFKDNSEWLAFEPNFYTGEEEDKRLIDGVNAINYIGHIQLHPAADWQPSEDKPEDNGWRLSDDVAVDVQIEEGFDYSFCDAYLVPCKEKWGHYISGADLEVICKK